MPAKISLVVGPSGSQTIAVEDADGQVRYLHSLNNPERDAQMMVRAFNFGGSGHGLLVVLGLGLGYHVVELAQKFPLAQILVVEMSEAVYQLAKQNGVLKRLAPLSQVTIKQLSSSASIIEEVTRAHLRSGLGPLAVFTLSGALLAFPEYREPLNELRATQQLKTWEKLRYKKFSHPQVCVAIIDAAYFVIKSLTCGLEANGHRVVHIPARTAREKAEVLKNMARCVLEHQPDFVLTINHLGFDEDGALANFLQAIELPVASWYVDSPDLIISAFAKNVTPLTGIFLWESFYEQNMRDLGFSQIIYLPLATDETIFKPLDTATRAKYAKRFNQEINFVGASMVETVEKWRKRVEPKLYPLVKRCAVNFDGFMSREKIEEELTESEREMLAGLSGKQRMDFEAAVIWEATLQYRLACLESLVGLPVDVFGDEDGWRRLLASRPGFTLHGPVDWYSELPALFNLSKISFNATSRQMMTAVNQRLFDVPACGGFVLSDYQSALEEMFCPGQEIAVYRDRGEIAELARFYLAHESERQAISQAGRRRVLAEHTYRHRMEKIVEQMRTRFGQ